MINNLQIKISKNKGFISINSFIILNNKKVYVGDIYGNIKNNNLELNINVNKEFRNKGISKILFSKLINYLKEPENFNIELLSLNVQPEELIDKYWLFEYYKKLGFKQINNNLMIYEL